MAVENTAGNLFLGTESKQYWSGFHLEDGSSDLSD